MEHLLSQAAADLTIRSQVDSTMSSMLYDIEMAHHLEQTLHQTNELQRVQGRLAALQARYEEREAAWEIERREKERMGMRMMEDIVKFSARGVRDEKERMAMELRLENAKNLAVTGPKKGDIVDGGASAMAAQKMLPGVAIAEEEVSGQSLSVVGNKLKTEPEVGQVKEEQNAIRMDAMSNVPDVSLDRGAAATTIIEETTTTQLESAPKNTIPEHKDEDNTIKVSNEDATQALPKKEQEPKHSELLPHDLNETSLLNIFSFLDPMDIINFAQTNKIMFSKIDVLFGTGGGSSDVEEDVAKESNVGDPEPLPSPNIQSTTEAVPATTAPPAIGGSTNPHPQVVSNKASVAPTSAADATNPQPSTSAPTEKPPSGASPKLFAMASPPLPPGASTFTQMFSRFGAAATPTTTAPIISASSSTSSFSATAATVSTTAPPASITTVPSTATPTDTSGSEIKLNAAMATSMASKLTPAELSIILRMREKLQKCEADAERWRLEKEDVVANLASVEAVKEFLVARVRDTERVVQDQKEEMKRMQQKNLADQEVIVFLDEKVKELEKKVEVMKSKEEGTLKEARDMVNKNEKKVRVLSDMLRFEREQMVANEKEWKSAKKVLVKEVKSCRARIVAMEAEQEGYRQQNVQLKEGLLSLTQSPGSPGRKKALKFR